MPGSKFTTETTRALSAKSLSMFCPFDGIMYAKGDTPQKILAKLCENGTILACRLRLLIEGSEWIKALHHRIGGDTDGSHHLPLCVIPQVWKPRDVESGVASGDGEVAAPEYKGGMWMPQEEVGTTFLPLIGDVKRSVGDALETDQQKGVLDEGIDALKSALVAAWQMEEIQADADRSQIRDLQNVEILMSIAMLELRALEPVIIEFQLWSIGSIEHGSEDSYLKSTMEDISKKVGTVMLALVEILRSSARAEAAVNKSAHRTDLSAMVERTKGFLSGYTLYAASQAEASSQDLDLRLLQPIFKTTLPNTFVNWMKISNQRMQMRRKSALQVSKSNRALWSAYALPWVLRRFDLTSVGPPSSGTGSAEQVHGVRFCVFTAENASECGYLTPYKHMSPDGQPQRIPEVRVFTSELRKEYTSAVDSQNMWLQDQLQTVGVGINSFMYRTKHPQEKSELQESFEMFGLKQPTHFGACLEVVGQAACATTPREVPPHPRNGPDGSHGTDGAHERTPLQEDPNSFLTSIMGQQVEIMKLFRTHARTLREEEHVAQMFYGLVKDLNAFIESNV
jgi:hypothetical protein